MNVCSSTRAPPGRRIVRVAHGVAVVILCLSAAACAPFWPTLKQDSDLTVANNSQALACVRPDSTTVQVPYACIEAARNELIDLENRAGYFERALDYTAVAGGTYAGYQASRTHVNNALLKHTAIGIAALIGFNQAVGADRQIVALDAGIDALDCVRKAAEAVGAEDAANIAMKIADVQSAYVPAGAIVGFTMEQQSALNLLSGLRSQEVIAANAALGKAITNAKTTAPSDVYDAVVTIRNQVRRQLAVKSVDVKAIYKAQQDVVNGMIGDIAKKSGAQQQATVRLQLISLANPIPAATPGKASQDAFHACVAPATGAE